MLTSRCLPPPLQVPKDLEEAKQGAFSALGGLGASLGAAAKKAMEEVDAAGAEGRRHLV